MKKERKIIMTLSGDGLTADELGRLERTIRRIIYRQAQKPVHGIRKHQIKKSEEEGEKNHGKNEPEI